jgi:UDP-N-acetylmuramate dehydrogenase
VSVQEREGVPLSQLTTLRLGGPARRVVEGLSEAEIVEAMRAADAGGEPVLVMGSGSNLVVADEGFDGTVLRVANRGFDWTAEGSDSRLMVGAGEPWDNVVARCVAEGFAGVECLSGIPGLVGATPIQNVGAYGQEVAQRILGVRVYDRPAGVVRELGPEKCGFGYRTSAFKRSTSHVVLAVAFGLQRSAESYPITYPELARTLGVGVGERAALGAARDAVLRLRRRKGMVLDPDDPDSVSAGSFFLNPVLSADEFAAFTQRVQRRLGDAVRAPSWPQGEDKVKVPAAWLIERAGFSRGYGVGRVGISSKHTLALVNRGGATTSELLGLARELRDGVRAAFGVALTPEPTLVGVAL